jgi:hypothetical protein
MDGESPGLAQLAGRQIETGPFGPVFRCFAYLLEVDRSVSGTTADVLEIHQRQFDDFRFFFLNDFNEFNVFFDFQHLPSPESRNEPSLQRRPK